MHNHPVIFSDLDGTLLDHYTYSSKPAAGLLTLLKAKNIPVIANTSKTREELLTIRLELGNNDPFIVENGSAVYLPQGIFKKLPDEVKRVDDKLFCRVFSRRRQYWLEILNDLPAGIRSQFRGFSTMTIQDIQSETGLQHEPATRAAAREFGEPLLWTGSEEKKKELMAIVWNAGGQVLAGGRFLHVGDRIDKGEAMQWLHGLYQEHNPDKQIFTIALGDSPNDVAMLESADYAIVIASPVHSPPQLRRAKGLVYSEKYGPEGWNEEIRKILHIDS